MTTLDNTELLLTLTTITGRGSDREPIYTSEQISISPMARFFLNQALNDIDPTKRDDARIPAKENVFRDVWDLIRHANAVVASDLSEAEWVAAGEPDLFSDGAE